MALVVYQGPANLDPTNNLGGDNSQFYDKKHKFVGLTNQGATCYLNGLLQTLYMTPEFRKAIFDWKYDVNKDGSEEFCIPLQLQRLFGLLQLSKQSAVDTIALTKSFGWEGFEVFQQQDVQELTRVLFDALEEAFKGTACEHIIDELYAGELVDYLQCIDVDYQSERIDKFLDFSLAIVPFGPEKPMNSLIECIEMFLKPERLDGENKYYVEKYDQRVDAIKGLKFGKLPYIMSVQLKRFVYDFSGPMITQKKLNNEIKYPMLLDMNPYVNKPHVPSFCSGNENEKQSDTVSSVEQVDIWSEGHERVGEEEQGGLYSDPIVPSLGDEESQREGGIRYSSYTKEEVQEMIVTCGEWIYELYAVLVHAGGQSAGGHYYAYIKDFTSSCWYLFNDSSVSQVTEQTVQSAWGGGGGGVKVGGIGSIGSYGSYYSSNASAYMLMYRKVCPDNLREVSEEMVPGYIREGVQREEEEKEQKRKEDEERRERLVLKFIYEGREVSVECKKSEKGEELWGRLWEQLGGEEILRGIMEREKSEQRQKTEGREGHGEEGEEGSKKKEESGEGETVRMDEGNVQRLEKRVGEEEGIDALSLLTPAERYSCLRIKDYNIYTKTLLHIYDYSTHRHNSLFALSLSEYKTYHLELKSPTEEWEEYVVEGFNIIIEVYDSDSQTFSEGKPVRVPQKATLGELKNKLKKMVPFEQIRIVKIFSVGYHDAREEELLEDMLRLRDNYHVYEGMKLFVENAFHPHPNAIYAISAFIEHRNRIEIRYSVSDRDDEKKGEELLIADARWDVRRLREEIGSRVGIEVEYCRLFKFSSKGIELKDNLERSSLGTQGVYNGIFLVVGKGRVLPSGYCEVKLARYESEGVVKGVTTLPEVEGEIQGIEGVQGMGKGGWVEGEIEGEKIPYLSPLDGVQGEWGGEGVVVGGVEGLDGEHWEGDWGEIERMGSLEVIGVEERGELGERGESSPYDNSSLTPISSSSPPPLAEGVEIEGVSLSLLHPIGDSEGGLKEAEAVEEEVEPSDFGLQMVKNSSSLTQFTDHADMSIVVTTHTVLSTLRKEVHSSLLASNLIEEGVTVGRLRLRERYGSNPGRILRGEGKTLGELGLYLADQKAIAYEVLPLGGEDWWALPGEEKGGEEEMGVEGEEAEWWAEVGVGTRTGTGKGGAGAEGDGDAIVLVQRFFRTSWSLSSKLEVLLPGERSVEDIALGLSLLFSLSPATMRVLVVPRETEFYLSDLPSASPLGNYGRAWFTPLGEKKKLRYMSHELGGLKEGDLLIVQDVTEPLRPLSKGDLKSMQIVREANKTYYNWGEEGGEYYGGIGPAPYGGWGGGGVRVSTGTGSAGVGGVGGKSIHAGSQGIKIRTQKDRQKENPSTPSIEGSAEDLSTLRGELSGRVLGGETRGRSSPVEMSAQTEGAFIGDEKEFQTQGGYTLFDGMI